MSAFCVTIKLVFQGFFLCSFLLFAPLIFFGDGEFGALGEEEAGEEVVEEDGDPDRDKDTEFLKEDNILSFLVLRSLGSKTSMLSIILSTASASGLFAGFLCTHTVKQLSGLLSRERMSLGNSSLLERCRLVCNGSYDFFSVKLKNRLYILTDNL